MKCRTCSQKSLYGNTRSLNYAVSSCCRKTFIAKSNENIPLCMDIFNCDDYDRLLAKQKQKLLIVLQTDSCCYYYSSLLFCFCNYCLIICFLFACLS